MRLNILSGNDLPDCQGCDSVIGKRSSTMLEIIGNDEKRLVVLCPFCMGSIAHVIDQYRKEAV